MNYSSRNRFYRYVDRSLLALVRFTHSHYEKQVISFFLRLCNKIEILIL
jgi:hypothetical protein